MIVIPNYRGFRIEIVAQPVGDAWDAGIRLRCPRSNEVRRAQYLSCHKSTPAEAEHIADVWARGWMDWMARLSRITRHATSQGKGSVHRQRSSVAFRVGSSTSEGFSEVEGEAYGGFATPKRDRGCPPIP